MQDAEATEPRIPIVHKEAEPPEPRMLVVRKEAAPPAQKLATPSEHESSLPASGQEYIPFPITESSLRESVYTPPMMSGTPQTPYYAIPAIPASSPVPQRKKLSSFLTVLLVVLALFLIVGGIVSYMAVNVVSEISVHHNVAVTARAKMAASATADANNAATADAATATIVGPNPYGGTLVLNDRLKDNSLGNSWVVSTNNYGSCQFANGAYIAGEIDSQYFSNCLAQNTDFSSFAYQVQMTLQNAQCGGLLFRYRSKQTFSGYYFRACFNPAVPQSGYYYLLFYGDGASSHGNMLGRGTLTSESAGSYTLAVVANGDTIDLYLNYHHITTIIDSSRSDGRIGVAAENNDHNNVLHTIAYNNVKVWRL